MSLSISSQGKKKKSKKDQVLGSDKEIRMKIPRMVMVYLKGQRLIMIKRKILCISSLIPSRSTVNQLGL